MTQPTAGSGGNWWDGLLYGEPIIPIGAAPNNGPSFNPNDPRWNNDPNRRGMYQTGGGGGGLPIGGGSGGSSAGASAAAGGAGAGAAGGGTAAAAGSSFWTNPQLWTSLIGAGAGYLGQRDANDAAAQANRPQPYWNQTTPWGPAQGNLEFGMQELLRRYQNQPSGPGGGGRGGRRGGGGGGGGTGGGSGSGSGTGLSAGMQGLLDSMVSRGTNVPDYIRDAQGVTSGMLEGGGSNPYLQGAYGMAEGYENPYSDDFISLLMGEQFAGGGSGGGSGQRIRPGQWSSGGSSSSGGGGGAGYSPNQWLRQSLDGQWLNDSNPHADALLETMANETREQYLRERAPSVDAEYIRAGRYGSDAYSRAQGYAAEEFGEALAQQQAGVRSELYENERNRMQDSLGLMTQGEIAAMQAAAQRDSASSAAGSARYAADIQAQLGNRGLLLDAIRGVSSDDMNRMGLMGDMAGLFTTERLGALNAIPGLEEAAWYGPQTAFGAGMADQSRRDDIQARREAQAAAARAQAENNSFRRWNMQQQMDQQRFDDLMRWSMGAGEAFGRQQGERAPNTFIPQGNTAAAALQGGMAGWMFGAGL